VHFPADSAAGALLGLTLGDYFVRRCTKETSYHAWKFDGTKFKDDFHWHALFDFERGQKEATTQDGSKYVECLGEQQMPNDHSPILCWLWEGAKKEWLAQPPY